MAVELMGSILIATEYITEAALKRSVLLVCDYSKLGMFGLILNGKKIELENIPAWIQEENITVLQGGTNNEESIFAIHDVVNIEHDHILTTNEFFSVSLITKDNYALVKEYHNCLFFSGYIQWSMQQFRQELKQNSWLTLPVAQDFLFGIDADDKYEYAVAKTGVQLWKLNPQTYFL